MLKSHGTLPLGQLNHSAHLGHGVVDSEAEDQEAEQEGDPLHPVQGGQRYSGEDRQGVTVYNKRGVIRVRGS